MLVKRIFNFWWVGTNTKVTKKCCQRKTFPFLAKKTPSGQSKFRFGSITTPEVPAILTYDFGIDMTFERGTPSYELTSLHAQIAVFRSSGVHAGVGDFHFWFQIECNILSICRCIFGSDIQSQKKLVVFSNKNSRWPRFCFTIPGGG